MAVMTLTTTDWRGWLDIAGAFAVAPGVHQPSAFSALLASTLSDVAERTVVDAGSGAGLISLAALRYGARHVVAVDSDAAALAVTAENVERLGGSAARARLSLWQTDFAELGTVRADVLAVNPPQRPVGVLDGVEPGQRHLHVGGGADGLQTVRLVLRHARCAELRTTAAAVLPVTAESLGSTELGWSPPRVLAEATLPMHPSWQPLTGSPEALVNVWSLRSRQDLR
jgi:SAM-dependent methyltransferase